ncbi:MAG: riboflavin synthase [Deltaproteobacteria bacterium]|nr:riboflavin synthase [Deltaproteobacteria bacterium]
MFTGIIQTIGKIKGFDKKGDFAGIIVEHNGGLSEVNTGDSVAVDGVCLTVVGFSPSLLEADISKETLNLTTLGRMKSGEKVNLEKALTPAMSMGGHFVTGHIDGVGFIKRKDMDGEFAILDFYVPDELQMQIAKKGSIAVNGVSLTVADIIEHGFRVAIIPHTLKNTTLAVRKQGDKVNIETDVIAKYVERFLSVKKKGIDEAFLKEHGFIRESH